MQQTNKQQTNISYLTLRRNLGILGLFLPLLVYVLNNFVLLPSISHYYYSHSIVMLIGVLFSYGLILLSYRGYPKQGTEWITDNWLTNIAAVCVIVVAFIPTKKISGFPLLNAPNENINPTLALIHMVCATSFFLIMAWMSFFRFTKTDGSYITATHKSHKYIRNVIYRVCGVGVVLSLAYILVFDIIIDKPHSPYIIFIGETFALFFFGTSWLVKSKALRGLGL